MINLSDFEKFIGRKVAVTKTDKKMKIGGKAVPYSTYTLNEEDPTILEIKSMYDNIRFHLPGHGYTSDYLINRLNIHIKETDDGSFRVESVAAG